MANTHKLLIDEESTPTVCDFCYQLALEMMPGIIYQHVETVPNVRYCEKCGKEEMITERHTFEIEFGKRQKRDHGTTYDVIADGSKIGVIDRFPEREASRQWQLCFWTFPALRDENTYIVGKTRDAVIAEFQRRFSDCGVCVGGCGRIMSRLNVSLICSDCSAKLAPRKTADEIMQEMANVPGNMCEHGFCDNCPFCEVKFCNDCGKKNPYYALWCEHCGNGEFLMSYDFLQETECTKCGVSYDTKIETENGLCPACFWHTYHYRIPFVDYPSYAKSLADMGFIVREPNRIYEFDSHHFEGFTEGKSYNVTLIGTGFGNPLYCISSTFREDAPMGFEMHASGIVNCYVERPLLALPEFSETTECALCGKGMAKYDCWHINHFGDLCQRCYSATSRILSYEY